MNNDEKIVKKLLEHDDKFEDIHQEIKNTKNELMNKMDEVLTIVQRNDIERMANIHRLDRMQGEINENTLEIKKVKKVLKVA